MPHTTCDATNVYTASTTQLDFDCATLGITATAGSVSTTTTAAAVVSRHLTSAQIVELAAVDIGPPARYQVPTGANRPAYRALTHAEIAQYAVLDNGVVWTSTSTISDTLVGTHVRVCAATATAVTGTATILDVTAYGTTAYGTAEVGVQLRRAQPAPRNHRQQPIRSHGRGSQFSNASPAELVALQLLRQLVSADDFRRYLRHGFVPVRAASGLVYQVDRHQRISVWDRGERVASLCVHLRGRGLPPTDEVVAKIIMIECDEADIWERANVSWLAARDRPALHQLGLAA